MDFTQLVQAGTEVNDARPEWAIGVQMELSVGGLSAVLQLYSATRIFPLPFWNADVSRAEPAPYRCYKRSRRGGSRVEGNGRKRREKCYHYEIKLLNCLSRKESRIVISKQDLAALSNIVPPFITITLAGVGRQVLSSKITVHASRLAPAHCQGPLSLSLRPWMRKLRMYFVGTMRALLLRRLRATCFKLRTVSHY